jgi:hypothetical protein
MMAWTKEKFLEYRKLKRSGYSHQDLINHFGDEIYESGLYNKNAHVLPYSQFVRNNQKMNEIKINHMETHYISSAMFSDFDKTKMDYLLYFNHSDVSYVICLMYFKINDTDTYNIIFTTLDNWIKYREKNTNYIKKGYLTIEEWTELDKIVSEETNYNEVYQLMKKISYIIFDYVKLNFQEVIFSIGETKNEQKINLYRNIIQHSFPNFKEEKVSFNGVTYYLYFDL